MGSIRNLGFMAWKNDLAYLESPHTNWKQIVNSENAMFTDALKGLDVKQFKKSFKSVSEPWIWSLKKAWEIERSPFSPEQVWKFVATGFKCKVWDGDVYDEFFAGAVQDSDGFERFTVKVFESGKLVANLQNTGPQVAWLKGSLVYLGSSRDLRYDSVCVWNPKTDSSKTLYTLEDPTENLELGRSEDGSVHVMRTDFVTKHLGFVNLKGEGIEWVDKASEIFVVSRDTWIRDMDAGVEAMSEKAHWSITLDHGIRTLWKDKTMMITVWGEISFDTREPHILHVSDMRYEPYVVNTKSWSLSKPRPYEFPCSYYTDVAPTFVVRPRLFEKKPAKNAKNIRGLLVTAYGAYGTPTKVGSLIPKWKPLLERGWAIASVCVPGSGDHDVAWKKAGQRQNRGEAIRVFTETVQRLQEELGVEASATALYGRSAGGLLVISAATLTPGLVGALYVESPYVDVLRTISNPELPLTLLETKEFGIGTNPTNVLATGAWSPMEHIPAGPVTPAESATPARPAEPAIPAKGISDLFVVARSDLADLEVYPYEVVKWIWRMRSLRSMRSMRSMRSLRSLHSMRKQGKKLLYIHSGQGHFTTGFESRAEDLALLDSWLQASASDMRKKNRSYKYNTMANGMSRKNRKNMTRKNRKDRKNRNNVTMGGKRRRSGRRGSRKH